MQIKQALEYEMLICSESDSAGSSASAQIKSAVDVVCVGVGGAFVGFAY